ncbi:hypothetical protein OS493_038535 [Desmophyllum pertusum]|uniref:Uncharacterized protein n=1 Tax=Desmophyllum pertusum TaxID=174260 RepID=A0A9W9Z6C4_9CNID|nr:hypothetical protein OS493_038535 [Desmophyllum pertusum]
MAESDSNDLHSASSIEDILNSLRLKLSDFCDSRDSSPKPDFKHILDEISDWVKEQKKIKEKPKHIFEDVGKVLLVTKNSIDKFKSQNRLEIMKGVLDITSAVGNLFGKPYSTIIGTICYVIGAILTKSKPQQPSVVDQLVKVVHDELVHFNKRLQDQKYDGLRHRVSDQKAQLLYEDILTKDPDVEDFVTALVTYCEAYCCFMALLIAAKGRFADLGSEYKEDEDVVDRKIACQREDAKVKLSFFSEEKYLTFLGRLPYEGGKLTKIVVLSRNMRANRLVEAVRCSLDLPKMQNLATVESAANKVSHQSVKVKAEGHLVLSESRFEWFLSSAFGTRFRVQFINETNFPIKIVSGGIGCRNTNLEFVQDVQPRASYPRKAFARSHFMRPAWFFTGGYVIIYLNGILSSDIEPPAEYARVIEFALGVGPFIPPRINIKDKTNDEFSHGQDAYNLMTTGAPEVLYWFESGVHFMARAEIVKIGFGDIQLWRFVIQDFDPFAVQD